ncbi:MAG: hypothetical protein M3044_10655 [Thermoproteota archaeon]|nr:hypothetical protein [Thermoproteota archaeon]
MESLHNGGLINVALKEKKGAPPPTLADSLKRTIYICIMLHVHPTDRPWDYTLQITFASPIPTDATLFLIPTIRLLTK